MHRKHESTKGFTLVEVLIVVVIMAVLAAVVIPQFFTVTEDAKETSLNHNIQAMRTQIQLYKMKHLDKLPRIIDNSLPQLTAATNEAGETGSSGEDCLFGPYVDEIPSNPFDGSKKVTAVATPGQKPTGVVGSLGGWQYDASNGSVWPNNTEHYK